jgi:hypothetical protein
VINHKLKCIFIHIPRTAGSSLSTAINKGDRREKGYIEGPIHFGKNWVVKEYGEDLWDEYFKFSFVRNPWDRLLSQYTWRRAKNQDDVQERDFNEWVLWRSTQTKKRETLTKQADTITCGNEIIVDFIGRYENLHQDYITLCKEIGISSPYELPHKHNKKSGRLPYNEIYTDVTRDIVKKYYSKDIGMFGYTF